MRRRPLAPGHVLATALLGAALLGATAAPAQAEAPAPEPDPGAAPPAPGAPSAPDLVLSGRNVRMTRGGVVGLRIGCRGTSAHVGEACIGSLTIRLASAVMMPVRRPGRRRPGQSPTVMRRIGPFNFAVKDFTLPVGTATQLRVRLSRRAQQVVRRQERVRVDLIAPYNSRAGASRNARRNVRFYFPKRPGV